VIAALTIPARVRLAPGRLAAVVRRAADRLDALEAEGGIARMDARGFAVISLLRRAAQEAKTPLQRFEHMMHPWVAFAILPSSPSSTRASPSTASALGSALEPLPLGIAVGLALGKQLGVFGATWLLVRSGAAALPQGVSWGHVYGVAWLTGIGFTMSLFVGGLAFPDPPSRGRPSSAS
jgi:Na+:H+ antiporter, NhaA family